MWRGAVSVVTHAAVRCGLLPDPKKLICEDCGKTAQCYDHRDYGQPLLVAPVCKRCNASRRTGLMPTMPHMPAIPMDGPRLRHGVYAPMSQRLTPLAPAPEPSGEAPSERAEAA